MDPGPVSLDYGYDRGLPVDRRYIEKFLAAHAHAVRGKCMEVQDGTYLRRYGGDDVTRIDVLDINPANAKATIHGDLHDLHMVPDDSYDCIVLTQTLQALREPWRGVRELWRILAVGGTLLLTVPCLGRESLDYEDCWRFMPEGLLSLFDDGIWRAELFRYGNALTGVGIWLGMAAEDLPERVWDVEGDPRWTCVLGVRAVKRGDPEVAVGRPDAVSPGAV